MTTSVQAPRPVATAPGSRQQRVLGALAGLLAAAVGLAAAELVAGVVGAESAPVVAVGDAAITLTPEPVKHFAISTFGQNDKVALVTGTLILVALYALFLGVLGLRHRRLAALGIAVFGGIGAIAALTRPSGGLLDALPSLVGAAAGVAALLVLLDPLTRPQPTAPSAGKVGPVAGRWTDRMRSALASTDRTAMDRRAFFLTGAVSLAAAAVAGGGGRFLQRRFQVADERAALVLPTPSSPAAALPRGADLAREVDGVTPLFTRNRDFYRIDTALVVPQVRPGDYRLSLRGMFDSPRTYTLPDLYDRADLIERDVTLTCVSNEIGGTLAGTARWLGVPLGAFLRENGVRPESSQLVCRSVDGMSIGAPTRSALDVEDAMLAIGMNGEPLPVRHGFPVRMVIPGLYGYVSACKWLTDIEATTYEAYDAYWIARDWAADGPVKVASRIDTPSAPFPAGRRAIAGVAWAQTRGISRVEVRVDEGEWSEAELAPEVDADVWRQWVLPYDFATGRHTITVRATSGDGELQPEVRADPFPSGATGWHTTEVIAG